ncbi:hypothetical protein TSOC_005250 [Tetrabaena socialis]|uniref:phytol kinase n=1 Tax=Tetrabaena socialis TaxID=47790 RepID=A0A2J8A6V1_9CHLO|nr:hypothetical protein TSOC_005250 [Tetrabaena socialis]|eukprot:PNH08251.1 hypothetical protein TSOC_005250 [Tetrabaena socialis]
MDTLQCLARQFAAAADSVGALTAQQARHAECLSYLLNSLTRAIHGGPALVEQLPLASMRRELAEVLRDSRIMEHAARLLLRLLQQGAPTGAALSVEHPTAEMPLAFLAVYQNICAHYNAMRAEAQGAAACAALREVLSGRCYRHVVLTHGVAALCMADGGPAYGLPTDVQQAVSARLAEASPAGPQEMQQLAEAIPLGLLAALTSVGPSQPVGAQATVMLLLRLARLAVTSADVWAAHAQQQGAGEALLHTSPPGMTAVLAGGLLPCLERLLRRAGEELDGPESVVMGALLRQNHAWRLWAHLLEYGEPRQAAALVATLGKLLRRASPTLLGLQARARPGNCFPVISLQGRQLPRLLAYAVCAWLPALSGCALQAMADQPAPESNGLWCLLRPLLTWLPLLVWRCTSAAGVEAATGSSSAAPSPSAADDAGGWQLLLLEEVRVVPLLGRALRLAQLPLPGFFPLARTALAQSCCAVAAAFPDEVLREARSSAWPPELLRALLPELWARGRGALVDGTEALAVMLEKGWAGLRGTSGSGGSIEALESILTAVAKLDAASCKLAEALVLPAEARVLLRTCSNRGCTSLAGDSEADARMRWCRFCNSTCYCCGECQLSHWREGGHKEACQGGAKVRRG